MSRIADGRFPQVEVRSPDALRSWLAARTERQEAVWLVTWKGSPTT